MGEYKVTIHSKSANITLAGSLVSGSTVPVVSGQATIGNVIGWTSPTTILTGAVVYRIDFENGKQVLFKTQSMAIQLEGKVGPGIVFRGPWSSTVDQYYYDPSIGRRDAVLYGGTGGTYYAAKSGSGDTTYLNPSANTYFSGSAGNASAGGYVTYLNYKTPGIDTDYWEALGTQELFVAAKIAIFEESYVQNTINVGTNALGSAANIILYGNVDRPYISIGQTGTIGYNNSGIWLGTFGSPGFTSRLSLVGSGGSLLWDGTNLSVSGAVNATSGNFSGFVTIGGAQIGVGVTGGTGIYINANNYWYDNGYFSLGNGSAGVTWNGTALNVNGVINATSGNFDGFMTVAGGSMKFGKDVSSTNDGLHIDANNYWYDSGNFSLGNGSAGVTWNGTALNVNGGGTFTGELSGGTINIGGNDATSFHVDSLGGMWLGADNSGFSTAPFRVTSAGAVTATSATITGNITATGGSFDGFMTAGTAKIGKDVSGTEDGILLDANNYWYAGEAKFRMGSANHYIHYDAANGGPTAYSSAGVALWVDSDGTNPGFAALTVNDGGLKVYNTLAANGGKAIDCVGNFYANGTGYFSGALSGGSTATFVGDVTANTSDKRLKTNIRKIDNALEKVSQINGVYYNFTDEALKLNHTLDKEEQVGLLAQEVQSVLPHIIKPAPFDIDRESGESISGENYLTIQYEKIVPLLLEAIKELKAEIDELKKNK